MKKKMKTCIYPLMLLLSVSCILTCCNNDDTTKQDPAITWANPEDISFGTTLSLSQLNAVADIPGTFVYTPGIGTKLEEGPDQELHVDFTPTDTILYNTAHKTVLITVTAPILVTDVDGNVYHAIVIGEQTWMAENLKARHYPNGTAIPWIEEGSVWANLDTTDEGYCYYDNSTDLENTYGVLYTWPAALKACPSGWHLPDENEWRELTDYLGGLDIAGGKMKETGLAHWASPNTCATDESGFGGLAAGYRNHGGYYGRLWAFSHFWSATEFSGTTAYYRQLYFGNARIYRNNYYKGTGFSVRCIKD
jgi:uncharacterized protein (TIGR02145 family)